MKLLASTLALFSIVVPVAPVRAQEAFHTQCRQWVGNTATAPFPCMVQFATDGYVGWIATPYDTYARGDGWAVGIRNKECLRSTGGGYQVAVCPITN